MGAEQSCCVVEEDESPDVILGLIQHENEMTGAMKSRVYRTPGLAQ